MLTYNFQLAKESLRARIERGGGGRGRDEEFDGGIDSGCDGEEIAGGERRSDIDGGEMDEEIGGVKGIESEEGEEGGNRDDAIAASEEGGTSFFFFLPFFAFLDVCGTCTSSAIRLSNIASPPVAILSSFSFSLFSLVGMTFSFHRCCTSNTSSTSDRR